MDLEAEKRKSLQMRQEREKESKQERKKERKRTQLRLFAMIAHMLGARPVDMMEYGSSEYQH